MTKSFESIINQQNKTIDWVAHYEDLAALNLKTIKRNLANNISVSSFTSKGVRVAKDQTSEAGRESTCEVCGSKTHFTVLVIDRRAYWCGCEVRDD